MKNKKNIISKMNIGFLILFLTSYFLSGCSYEKVNSNDINIAEKADEYIKVFNEVCTKNRYMGNVLIEKEGRIVFQKSYGMSDFENNIPNEEDTVFRIGSMSKSFTATAILQLHEKGLLNINDPISKYILLKEKENKITIENLLNHTSGLTRDRSFYSLKIQSNEGIYLCTECEPGIEWRYSNYGYKLLAYIIEVVSRMTYEDYLKENIFEPLNMTNTGCDKSDDKIPNLASPHGLYIGGVKNGLDIDTSYLIGSGNIYSTNNDLCLFFRALDDRKLLKQETLDMMFTDNTGLTANYGYGLQLFKLRGHKCIGHGGAIRGALPCGYRSMALRFPDDDITVILLLNVYFDYGDYDMAAPLAAIALGEEYYMPITGEEINLSEEELKKYEGDYKISDKDFIDLIITIKRTKDNYLEVVPSGNRMVLIPYSKSEFIVKGVEYYKVIFSFDDNKNVNGLILKSNVEKLYESEKIK